MSSVPFIISTLSGIFGRDALTHELREVKWGEVCGDGSDEDCSVPAKDVTYDILLTVGFVPGLKVDAILLLRTIKIWNHSRDEGLHQAGEGIRGTELRLSEMTEIDPSSN
ncbi:hypothetical protein ACFXTI_007244 [Malus domestica]